MIFTYLIPRLEENFRDRNFTINPSGDQILFPAAHPEFGDIDIRDDGDEITLIAGKFTHGHFSNYDEGLSEEEKSKRIAEAVAAFLKAVFADQIVFWGSHKGGGGWHQRGNPGGWSKIRFFSKPNNEFVWSGPLQ